MRKQESGSYPLRTNPPPQIIFTFDILAEDDLRKTVSCMKPSSCSLDLIPADLFKSTYHMSLNTHPIMNSFLGCGIVSNPYETATAKPLFPPKKELRPLLSLYFPRHLVSLGFQGEGWHNIQPISLSLQTFVIRKRFLSLSQTDTCLC